jgi:hypothetical protein
MRKLLSINDISCVQRLQDRVAGEEETIAYIKSAFRL